LGHEEPDGLHLRRPGCRGDETGGLPIAILLQDFPAPCAHVQEKGFVIRRVRDIDVVYPYADIPRSLENLLLEPLGIEERVCRCKDMNGIKGSLRKQSENRPVGKDALHGFGIVRITVAGKSKKNIHKLYPLSVYSFSRHSSHLLYL
jgi:hypothetical protein